VFVCFTLASSAESILVSATFILVGLAFAILLRFGLYALFIISIPFVVVTKFPAPLTLSVSDVILPVVCAVIIRNYVRRPDKSLRNLLKNPIIWILLLLGAILLSAIQENLNWAEYLLAIAKLAVAITGGLAAVGIIFEYKDDYQFKISLLRTWVLTSFGIASLGLLGYFAQIFGIPSRFMYQSARLQGTFDNPNAYAAYGLISLALALLYNVHQRRRFNSLYTYTIFASLVLSNSRASQIAEVIFLILGFALLVRTTADLKSWIFFAVPNLMILVLFLPLMTFTISLFTPGGTIAGPPHSSPGPIPPSEVPSGAASTTPSAIPPSEVPSGAASTTPSAIPPSEVPSGPASTTTNPIQPRESIGDDSRFHIWSFALNLWKSSPLWGRGLGQFISLSKEQLGTGYVVHNSFLSFLVETGILGGLVFVSVFIALLVLLIRSKSVTGKILALGIVVSCVMMSSNNLENSRALWVLMGSAYAWLTITTGTKSLRAPDSIGGNPTRAGRARGRIPAST